MEYDLNDKSLMSREEPARAGDTDPKLSVSGCQQFLGEDLSFAHRARIQQQEQRLWNEEQIAAKQAAKNQLGDLDSTYAQRAMEIDAIKAQLESTAATGRKAQAVAVAEYQLAQASAKRERERADQVTTLQDNIEEIQNNLASSPAGSRAQAQHSAVPLCRLPSPAARAAADRC